MMELGGAILSFCDPDLSGFQLIHQGNRLRCSEDLGIQGAFLQQSYQHVDGGRMQSEFRFVRQDNSRQLGLERRVARQMKRNVPSDNAFALK